MSKSSKKQTDVNSNTMPIVDPTWKKGFDQFLGDTQSMQGNPTLNPSQVQARDYFSANTNPTQYTLAPAQQVTAGKVTPYLWNAQRGTQMDAAATTDAVYNPFSATQGSQYAKDYMDPYLKDVVDTSLSDYDANAARTLAANQAARGAGSAFGTGANVGDALFSADSARGRASLDAGLRSQGFQQANAFGMSDADRFTQTAGANAQGALAASEFNAGAKNTSSANATSAEALRRAQEAARIDTASQDNVHNFATADAANADRALAADTGNAGRALAVDQGNADLFGANRAFGQSNAGALAAMGQTEFGQGQSTWENLLRALTLGTSQFGQNTTGTNTETKTPGLFDWLSLASGTATGLAKAGAK